jgi:hypothetical protein
MGEESIRVGGLSMVHIRAIRLDIDIEGTPIRLTKAFVPSEAGIPFILVKYTITGNEQEEALRFDLHKRVFLGDFDDKPLFQGLQGSAEEVIRALRNAGAAHA